VCAKLGGNKPLDAPRFGVASAGTPTFRSRSISGTAPAIREAEVDAYIARKIRERDDPVRAAANVNVCSAASGGGVKSGRGRAPSGDDAAIKDSKAN